MARLDCFNVFISKQFYRYGKLLARHPAVFLIVPLVVAACLSSGMLFLTIETDATYLFTPDDSRAKDEILEMSKLFPVDHERFYPNRLLTNYEQSGNIVVTAKGSGNVLDEDTMEEIVQLNKLVRTMELKSVGFNGTITFADICVHFQPDECFDDPVLKLLNYTSKNVKTMNFTYPLSYLNLADMITMPADTTFDFLPEGLSEGNPFSFDDAGDFLSAFPDLSYLIPNAPKNISINIGATLGGVVLYEGTDIVKSAEAMFLMYFLRSSTEEETLLAGEWEQLFLQKLVEVGKTYKHIELSMFASSTLSDELIAMASRVMPRFCITFSLLIMFAVGSCMMADWVQSKPWLGQFGVISAMLAIASSMGLLSYCGVPFNEVTASMPFLAIGIGIDDMFIMLATWRKTSVRLPVEERLGQTYSEAAVSITITSVTDALAFGIGSITKLPAIRVFCLYTGIAIIFDYLYQISFFGACMVYTGRREANNKHCTTLKQVLPKDEATSKCYYICCAGGVSKTSSSGEHSEHALMRFFKNYYGPFITTPIMKVFTVLLYMVYVAAAILGCFHVTEGMQYKDIFSDDSYAHTFMIERVQYFTAFAVPVGVVFTEPLAYWEKDVQLQVENITQTFEQNKYVYDSRFTDSWLRKYLEYLEMEEIYSIRSNSTGLDKDLFISRLQDSFLTHPLYEQFSLDVRFETVSDEVVIASSRLVLMPGNLTTTIEESNFMLEIRALADAAPVPVLVTSPPFEFFEQYLVVLPNTIQNLIIATVCMCIISLIFIPHPISALMITFCIISIEVGIIGFMSFWGVNMDGVSMINIILCIGFSVDFSAHITYSFVTAPCDTGNEAAIYALHSLGMPIVQGALSTIVGIIAIATSPAYIFRSFFKTMFLVMTLGLLHGILFLPVLLTLLRPCMRLKKRKPNEKADKNVIEIVIDPENNKPKMETGIETVRLSVKNGNGVVARDDPVEKKEAIPVEADDENEPEKEAFL
ncbi:patched domain-containing protein 3-like isoform X1 [Asterias amurensis]|uniref:patched domain-containing protein 3-like isoform X1 n=1 Tax=Asterias amurensis TaxID=7602 RepID=UPI003AB3DE52